MKTNIKLLCGILLAATATLFASCYKETEASIVGTWAAASDQLFNENGTFTAIMKTMDEEYTAEELSGACEVFTKDGKQNISIVAEDQESGGTDFSPSNSVRQITTISENLLVLEHTDTDEDMYGNPYNYKHIITLKRK